MNLPVARKGTPKSEIKCRWGKKRGKSVGESDESNLTVPNWDGGPDDLQRTD